MQFTYRDKTYTLPVQLADITLGQWIAYKQRCRNQRAIDNVFGDGVEIPGLEERLFLSMFANIPLEEIDEFISLADVRTFSGTALFMLEEEEAAIAPLLQFEFSGKRCTVEPPFVRPEELGYSWYQQSNKLIGALRAFTRFDDYEALRRIVHSFVRVEGSHPFDKQIRDEDESFNAIDALPLDLAFGVIRFISDSAVVSGYLSRNSISTEP